MSKNRIMIGPKWLVIALFLFVLLLSISHWPVQHLADGAQVVAATKPANLETLSASTVVSSIDENEVRQPPQDVSFSHYLTLLEEQQSHYLARLDRILFGLLAFSDASEFSQLVQHGLPQAADIAFVSGYDTTELSQLLFNQHKELAEKHAEQNINIQAISLLNFIEAIATAEQVISYFSPGFTFENNSQQSLTWPTGLMPEQVKDALTSLVFASASLRDETALPLLAKARFIDIMTVWNNDSDEPSHIMLKHFAQASQLLPHLQIDNYIKQRYPAHFQQYVLIKTAKNTKSR